MILKKFNFIQSWNIREGVYVQSLSQRAKSNSPTVRTCKCYLNVLSEINRCEKRLLASYYIVSLLLFIHVRWVTCHHGMVVPQVADGGDDFQIWRVVTNILNKHLQTADKGWSSSLGVGCGANNSSP
jgi:hypothetical protein